MSAAVWSAQSTSIFSPGLWSMHGSLGLQGIFSVVFAELGVHEWRFLLFLTATFAVFMPKQAQRNTAFNRLFVNGLVVRDHRVPSGNGRDTLS